MHASAVLPATHMRSDFADFIQGAGVCHVTVLTTAESNPDMGLLTRPTFCVSPDVLAKTNKNANNGNVDSF